MAHFKTAKAEIAHLKGVLRKFARSRNENFQKHAELGGDGKDVQFEQAFSNLAHAYLKDKAPSLQQYELGFQLLERNQDSTKAVAIIGFKIGPQLVYAPVFFLNGDLKGHELLYLKDQDQFVPMKENWINFILNKKPNILGESTDRNLGQQGITPPDLAQMNNSPSKMGSAIRPDLLPGVAAFAHFAVTNPFTDPKYKDMMDLETFLKKEGSMVIESLVRGLMECPPLAEKFANDFNGMEIIRRAVEASKQVEEMLGVLPSEKTAMQTWALGDKPPRKHQAPSAANGGKRSDGSDAWKATNGYIRNPANPNDYMKEAASATWGLDAAGKLRKKYVPKSHQNTGVLQEVQQPGAMKASSLQIVTLDRFDPKSNLSANGREILLRDGVYFHDKRAEDSVSTAYEVSTLKLTNPTETGLYDVLVKPGRFERCLVMFGPHDENERKTFTTVVRVDGEKNWLNIHSSRLWVRQKTETNGEDYNTWLAGLPAADSLSKSDTAVYMLVGPGGQGSCPFKVERELSTDGGIKNYDVWFRGYADGGDRPSNLPRLASREYGYDRCCGDRGERIVLTGKDGGLMRTGGSDLYVPKGFKLLTIKADKSTGSDYDGVLEGFGPTEADSPAPPIMPGDNIDLQRAIYEKTAALKVCHTGSEVQIDGQSMSPTGALIHLVRDVGLRVKQAKIILKEAEAKQVSRYRIKVANNPNPLTTGPGPNAPGMAEGPMASLDPYSSGAAAQMPFEQQSRVDMPLGDPSQYQTMPAPAPDPMAAQSVMQAAQTGQKEVLDTSAIGSILKSVRDDTMIDRNIPDLMKGLDRLGRILFSFYWHGDEFQDRFGKQDMPELEDSLRNSFENVGDVVLFLKQKTIEPFPEEMAHADLGQAA
jgi:hypothetical protein